MLQSPTIFKQTADATRQGFQSLVDLVQTEANTFKQNRMLAIQQAQKAAQMAQKFQYDVALEQEKVKAQASAPPSRTTILNKELERSTRINQFFASNPEGASRLGMSQIQSRLDPNTGMFVDYMLGKNADGQDVPVVVEMEQMQTMVKMFNDAEAALNTINGLQSAGLPAVGFDQFAGSSDLVTIVENLRSADPRAVALGLDTFKRVSGRLPTVEVIKERIRPPSEGQRKEQTEFVSARGQVPQLFNSAQPYLTQSPGGLNPILPQDLTGKPVGYLLGELNKRLNTIKASGEKAMDNNSGLRAEYLALDQLYTQIKTLVDKYPSVSNYKGSDYNDLYFNDKWTSGSDPADVFITTTQRNALSPTGQITPGTNRIYQATSNFVNALSQ